MKLLYIDSSAFIKRYVIEEDSEKCQELISQFSLHCISNIGTTEVLINLKKRLGNREHFLASRLFEADLAAVNVIAFDDQISQEAVKVSDGKNLATLDSIHIATALRFKSRDVTFLTYDKAQAQAARRNGLKTLGVLTSG